METIHIYHMNDWHSHFENWPRVYRYYQAAKANRQAQGETVYLIDGGDFCDRQHPLTEASDGQANIEFLNDLPVDLVTIGNNEGIGNLKPHLNQLYQQANFPVIVNNIVDIATANLPKYIQASHIIRTESGARILFLAATAPYQVSYKVIGWQPLDPIACISQELARHQAAEDYDFIFLISHLGVDVDRELAQHFPEIRVIFGGHTHHVLPVGEWQGQTLLTGAGKYGHYLGHLSFQIEQNPDDTYQISELKDQLIASHDMESQPDDQTLINKWYNQGNSALNQQTVGYIASSLAASEHQVSDLQYFTLEAIKWATGADIAVLNSGLFLNSLGQGRVSRYDLHQALPHPMRVMTVELSGEELLAIYQEFLSLQDQLIKQEIKGMGFRGNIFGQLAFDQAFKPDEIQIDQNYCLASVDHLIYLPYFKKLKELDYQLASPKFLRQLVADYVQFINKE